MTNVSSYCIFCVLCPPSGR